ncbi:MAG: pyridoxal-phosphate dependent enzyme, partial [Ktedonobacteraceae bacterium]|nr:pyridoxal-phosphate dependent enzyme [Ktedonobacteraceae bacterium]
MRPVKNEDSPPVEEARPTRARHARPTGEAGASAPTVTATPVTIADIWEAYKLLKPRLHHTPLTASRTLRELTGADVYLKAENMQRSGSFKVRGASYKLSR